PALSRRSARGESAEGRSGCPWLRLSDGNTSWVAVRFSGERLVLVVEGDDGATPRSAPAWSPRTRSSITCRGEPEGGRAHLPASAPRERDSPRERTHRSGSVRPRFRGDD